MAPVLSSKVSICSCDSSFVIPMVEGLFSVGENNLRLPFWSHANKTLSSSAIINEPFLAQFASSSKGNQRGGECLVSTVCPCA